MARKKAVKKLNEQSKEVIEQSFLQEDPEVTAKLEKQLSVPIFRDIPKTQRIVFLNNRDPGIPLEFHYATGTHPLKHYKLFHGHSYVLPVEVILHLEGENPNDLHSCQKRTYGSHTNEYGVTAPQVNGYVPYYQCRTVRS